MLELVRDTLDQCASTALCTSTRRVPRKIWFMTTAFFTAMTTFCTLVCVSTDQWEVTTFDIDLLFNSTMSRPTQCAYTELTPLAGVNKSGWVLTTYAQAAESTPGDQNCEGAGRVQNISLVFRQHGSAFRLCLDIDEELWRTLSALCRPHAFDRCLVYDAESVKSPFCCVRCLYTKDEVEDMDEMGETSFEPIFTVIGFLIVSLIVLGVCHFLAIIAFWKRIVPVVLITGILFLVSGTFLAFCLAAHQFKIEIMNTKRRTLPHMTPEMVSSSRTVLSWSVDIGWMAFAFSVLTGILWIRFSYYLASDVSCNNKVRPTMTLLTSNNFKPKHTVNNNGDGAGSPKPFPSPNAMLVPKSVRWASNAPQVPGRDTSSTLVPNSRPDSGSKLLPTETSQAVTSPTVIASPNGSIGVPHPNKHPMMVEESV